MTTARMDDILRQRHPALKAAVLSVLEGDPGAAMEMLGAGVHEVDYDDLGAKAAEAWLALDPARRDSTLLLPRRRMRCARRSTRRCARGWRRRGRSGAGRSASSGWSISA